MKKVLKKRAGFTLVELLIVIIIIGILAGAMLLVAGSGTDKAEATKIVSNLRSLKAAALLYYADNTNGAKPTIASLEPYMDRKVTDGGSGTYVVDDGAASTDWYVGRTDVPSGGVETKLAQLAKTTGLVGSTTSSADYASGETVYMKAR